MGRAPCCGDHEGLKKGPWTAEEDQKLIHYAQSHGLGNWRSLPKLAGLSRCGKSCRLRWANYLRPDIKRGTFSMQEDLTIIRLHAVVGNKWSAIASHLPGRTDNEIKNHWNTKLKKRLLLLGIDPVTHMSLPRTDILSSFMASSSTAIAARLNNALAESQLGQLVRDSVNISQHVDSAGSAQYSWQLSQILKLLGPFSSISTDALKWLHVSQNQFNQGFLSGQKDNSTEYNAFSQESSQFSDLEQKSEGKNLPITTDDRNEHWIASSLIKDQPSTFNTEITEWNSMPILMPSINPDKNDQLFYYSNQKSSSTTFTNSFSGGSEILENTIPYHQDDPFGSEIRTSDTVSPPTDRQEDESNYWVDLLNSIEGSNPDTDYMNLVPLSSP